MKKYEKEVLQSRLDAEANELRHLKAIYNKASEDIIKKIEISNGKINVLLSNWDNLTEEEKSIYQSQIYQRDFQKSLKTQIDGFLKDLNSKQYATMTEYMEDCYKNGYLGAMYSIHKQGIPIISPIDQKKVTKAMFTDSKISKKLYTKLGEDVEVLKKRIANNLSRGIATASEYKVIARNIAADSNVGFNRAMRIARTEGNRISNESAYDASIAAKEKGADVVKSWDAALDGRTRESHARVDGEIRELDEKFSNGLKYPGDSAGGAAEVVNCRCALLQRARWALDDEFTKMNNFTKEIESFDSPKTYAEFKKGFFSDGNIKYMNYVERMEKKYRTKDFRKVLDSMTEREYKHYSKLVENNPMFNKKRLIAAEEVIEKVKQPAFTPAKTVEEAEEYAKQFVKEKTWSGNGNVSYKGLSLESANKFNETLLNLYEQNDIHLLNNIQPMNFRQTIWKGSETTPMAYRSAGDGDLFFNPKIMKNAKSLDAYMEEGRKAFKTCAENIDKFKGTDRELIETYLKAGSSLVAETTDDAMKTIIEHEMGHHIQHSIIYNSEEMAKIVADGFEEYGVKISGYATKTKGEYIAESYAAFCNGKAELIDPKLKDIFENIRKTGRN